MLLLYGNELVSPDWQVHEKIPPLFSRLYYVFSGKVHYYDELCEEVLEPDTLYLFPSSRPYRMSQEPENRLACLFLHLDLSPEIVTELVKIRVSQDPFLQSLLHTIQLAMEQEEDGRYSLLSTLSDTLVLYLKQHEVMKKLSPQISLTLKYISEHPDADTTVAKLSSLCGYHPQYFIRLFSRMVGITPHQYMIGYRLRLSARMLQSDRSITEISGLTGYPDVKTYSRAFKKQFGLSPSRYRKFFQTTP